MAGVGDEGAGPIEELSGKQMADALVAAGSEPGFFMLDADGKLLEDDPCADLGELPS